MLKLESSHYAPYPAESIVDDYFDVNSLAAHLQKTPGEIRKMAERDQLPGKRIGGEWRFDRSEIFHWIESYIGSASPQNLLSIEKILRPARQPFASVIDLLEEQLVFPAFPSRSRHSLVTNFCNRLADTGRLWVPTAMATAILAREEMHSTALENGVALLHSRRPQPSLFDDPFIALAITPSGIPFGGPRGVLTDIFFLIASRDESSHLQVLARLSRLIMSADLLANLREATSARDLLDEIRSAEEALDKIP